MDEQECGPDTFNLYMGLYIEMYLLTFDGVFFFLWTIIIELLIMAASMGHRGGHNWEEEHACGLPQIMRCLPVLHVQLTHQCFFFRSGLEQLSIRLLHLQFTLNITSFLMHGLREQGFFPSHSSSVHVNVQVSSLQFLFHTPIWFGSRDGRHPSRLGQHIVCAPKPSYLRDRSHSVAVTAVFTTRFRSLEVK